MKKPEIIDEYKLEHSNTTFLAIPFKLTKKEEYLKKIIEIPNILHGTTDDINILLLHTMPKDLFPMENDKIKTSIVDPWNYPLRLWIINKTSELQTFKKIWKDSGNLNEKFYFLAIKTNNDYGTLISYLENAFKLKKYYDDLEYINNIDILLGKMNMDILVISLGHDGCSMLITYTNGMGNFGESIIKSLME